MNSMRHGARFFGATTGAKSAFLKCKLNSEVCKDGRWCALTHVLDGVSYPAIWILKVPVANGFHALGLSHLRMKPKLRQARCSPSAQIKAAHTDHGLKWLSSKGFGA